MSTALSGSPQVPGDTPGVDANLNNTLSAQGILTQMQAELARQSAARAAAVGAATTAASKAGSEYGQAATAPVPDVDPMTKLMTGMGGDVASIMARNPEYGDRAQKSIDEMHADLVRKRASNLQALHDIYEQRAATARAMGDQATELDSRTKMDQMGKALDVVLQGQRDTAAMRQTQAQGANTLANTRLAGENTVTAERVRGEEARKTQSALLSLYGPGGTGAAGGGGASAFVHTDRAVPYVDLADATLPKSKQALQNLARQQTAAGNYTAIIGPKEHAALKQIDNVKMGLADVYDQALQWLPKSADDPRRALLGVRSLVDPALKSWGANRMTAVTQISTLMSAGTGSRMNQKMIDLAIQNDLPDVGGWNHPSDWVDSAAAKKTRLDAIFDNYEASVLGVPGALAKLQATVRADYAAAKQKGIEAATPGAKKSTSIVPGTVSAEDEASAYRRKR